MQVDFNLNTAGKFFDILELKLNIKWIWIFRTDSVALAQLCFSLNVLDL